MSKPILHVFLISHYCEKARWALDLCEIDYQLNLLSPLSHSKTAKEIGAQSAALPILQTTTGVIQGSASIIEWASSQACKNGKSGLSITPESTLIEKRLDDVLGVHARRWFYSEALLDCPESVKPVFAVGSGFLKRAALSLAWPKVVATMIKRMDLGPDQELESRTIVSGELDWLESMLDDRSDYLVEGSISNADIAAASLIAPMFVPPNHPAATIITVPPRAAATASQWRSRPVANWLMKLYQENR